MRHLFMGRLWVIGLLLLLVCNVSGAEKCIKVACVGNSITYGAGINNREKNAYPAQLQYFLGDGYRVQNFGSNGATAQTDGDYPYVRTEVYKNSLEFEPDIVLIKLGTNDTKPQNWKGKERFMEDLQHLIDAYKGLPSDPKVVLLTPVRCFLTEKNTISPERIEKEVRESVEQLAYRNGLGIVNLFNIFGDQWDGALMPDRLHPSAIGAGIMARKTGEFILNMTGGKEVAPASYGGTAFNFHGYRGEDFKVDGVECKIVKPAKEAKGKPWVWRARFWGHEPQTDIDLLEQGFHIAYCDVADLYGADKAVKRWNRFYRFMTGQGFNRKVVLEGMSRGGLIVYNWAAQNPDKVACIYADAPVMDFKSWPMGKGKYAGSETDIQQLMKAYGFKNEAEALKWHGNPLDHVEKIARAGFPVLHVVGDADEIVPVEENTALFEKGMKEKKGNIRVIHKPGIGHHPHSLNNPEKIVNFILKATGHFLNPCTRAVPGNEYRSGAGWKEGAEWHAIAGEVESELDGRGLDVLLVGNSITQGWGGERKLVTYKPGKAAMDRMAGEGNWASAGISGDRTQNVLWRLRNGNYNRCRPKNVVIAIGINNLISGGDDAEDTAEGIIAVTEEACREFPESKIILLGLFPSGKEKDCEVRRQCNRIHEVLGGHSFDKRVVYVNPTEWFLDEKGTIKGDLYSGDYIHLTEKGYECVAEKLKELIEREKAVRTVWYEPAKDSCLPVHGRWWNAEIGGHFQRLPDRAAELVRKPVWDLSLQTAGLYVKFYTNATSVRVRYQVTGGLSMVHMPATGVSGVDLYSMDCDGVVNWCAGNYQFGDTIQYSYEDLTDRNTHKKGNEYTLYLPLYNGVKWLQIGVPEGCRMDFVKPSVEKPVVVYGTSIAQGACASRPGMAWTNILQRKLDKPVVNLGFSGNGQLDESMFRLLSECDAAVYVIDCMPNMTKERVKLIRERLIKGIGILREKNETPILLVEHDGYMGYRASDKKGALFNQTNKELKATYEALKDSVRNLYYLSFEEIGMGMDSQVDGVHATDLGMQQYAEAYYRKITSVLYPELQPTVFVPARQHRDSYTYQWNDRHEEILKYNETEKPEIVMLGNSITHFWGGEPFEKRRVADEVWQKLFKGKRVVNLGFGWDRLENVMWRIQHGELDGYSAQKIFMMLGTNNLSVNTNEEIVSGIKEIVSWIKIKQPDAKLYVVKILPRRNMEERLGVLNGLLEEAVATDRKVQVIDLTDVLIGKDGKIDEKLFSDGLHPNCEGYKRIAKVLRKYVMQ